MYMYVKNVYFFLQIKIYIIIYIINKVRMDGRRFDTVLV